METIMKERNLAEWGNIWTNEKYFMRAYQAFNRLDLETRKEANEIAAKYPCSAEHVANVIMTHGFDKEAVEEYIQQELMLAAAHF